MKSLHWQRIESLYEAALALEAAARVEFLQHECGGDDELQREVTSLLAAHDEAGGFLEEPAVKLTQALRLGSQIGQYKLLSLLGVGGMGEVYLAEDTRLHRQVALKLLPAEFSRDAGRVRRFEQEARATTALNHPHIVTLYDTGQHADSYFIVNEFVDGQTLREHLNARGVLPVAEALSIAEQIAKALAAAHAAGIAHRDIKPENVMLRRDGFVKVLDFGLAKQLEMRDEEDGVRSEESELLPQAAINKPQSQTGAGVLLGTIRYMSPEQARGGRVDARTDVFSLGVVLYEMLAGRAPFERATAVETLAAILEAEPAALPEAVPASLRGLLTKALRKEREERWRSAEELAMAVREIAEELQFSVRLAARSKPAWRGLARRWLVRAGAVLLALFAGWFGWQGLRGVIMPNRMPQRMLELSAVWNLTENEESDQYHLSPDEQKIAFTKGEGGQIDIYVKPVGGGAAVRLTNDAWVDEQPLWSSDGQQLVYVSTRNGKKELRRISAQGGAGELVKELVGYQQLIVWSQDGRRIFYHTDCDLYTLDLQTGAINRQTNFAKLNCKISKMALARDESWVAYTEQVNGSYQIWVLNLNVGTPIQVTHEEESSLTPLWHPDNERLIYGCKRQGVQQLCVGYLDGRPPVQLTHGQENLRPWHITQDGSRILAQSERGNAALFRYDLGAGEETRLDTGAALALSPALTSDGQTIAYQQAADDAHILSGAILAQGQTPAAPPVQLAANAFDPRWSPLNDRVAFLRYQSGVWSLWASRRNGQAEQALVKEGLDFGGFSSLPFHWRDAANYSWSPDGRRLACVIITPNKTAKVRNVWLVNDEGGAQKLTNNADPFVRFSNPVWPPAGEELAYLIKRETSGVVSWGVALVKAGQSRVIYQAARALRLLGWAQSGQELIVASAASSVPAEVELLRLHVVTGQATLLTTLPTAYFFSVLLAPDQQQAAFTRRVNGRDELWAVALADGRMRRLRASEDATAYFAGLSWSPDAGSIYFSKQSKASALWTLNNFPNP